MCETQQDSSVIDSNLLVCPRLYVGVVIQWRRPLYYTLLDCSRFVGFPCIDVLRSKIPKIWRIWKRVIKMYYWEISTQIRTKKELSRYEIYKAFDKALTELGLDNIEGELTIEMWESLEDAWHLRDFPDQQERCTGMWILHSRLGVFGRVWKKTHIGKVVQSEILESPGNQRISQGRLFRTQALNFLGGKPPLIAFFPIFAISVTHTDTIQKM